MQTPVPSQPQRIYRGGVAAPPRPQPPARHRRPVVDLMLEGYDVTNFDSMDEREVVQLYAQDVPDTPRVIGIGSSRVLQLNRELVGDDSFFNMGVTGADVRDCMTS